MRGGGTKTGGGGGAKYGPGAKTGPPNPIPKKTRAEAGEATVNKAARAAAENTAGLAAAATIRPIIAISVVSARSQ